MYSPFDLPDTPPPQRRLPPQPPIPQFQRPNPYLQVPKYYQQQPMNPHQPQFIPPNLYPPHLQYNPQLQHNYHNPVLQPNRNQIPIPRPQPPVQSNQTVPKYTNQISNQIEKKESNQESNQSKSLSFSDLLTKLSNEAKAKQQMNIQKNTMDSTYNNRTFNTNYNPNFNQNINHIHNNQLINSGNSSIIQNQNQLTNSTLPIKRQFRIEYDYQDPSNYKNKRMKRFDADTIYNNNTQQNTNYITINKDQPIIGTCTNIEKEYYRMQETDPSKIRPLYILKKSLVHLETLWKSGGMDYLGICNQMKSIRQDLTVQQIRNEFSVKVYESHARIALENKDFSEFNQCQTKLQSLYECNPNQPNEMEFTAYRLLYKLNDNRGHHTLLLRDIQTLTDSQKNHSFIKHALQVVTAYYSNNFYQFFTLYKSAPNLGKSVINLHIDSVRKSFITILKRAYITPLSLQWFSDQLAFENINICKEYLGDKIIIIKENEEELIDLKKSKIG